MSPALSLSPSDRWSPFRTNIVAVCGLSAISALYVGKVESNADKF